MTHLSEDQLLDTYYAEELPPEPRHHLTVCSECRANFAALTHTLDRLRDYQPPERGADYAGQVWSRLLPVLPPVKRPRSWFNWWSMAPVFASLLAIAFLVGRFTVRSSRPESVEISDKSRERVLLFSLSDHLERSQIVLSEIANAAPGSSEFTSERDRAHELIGANRLLRQTAIRLGDRKDAALLDELERVLLDVANGAPEDLDSLQRRIDQKGLLFKVRITSADTRERGQKL